MGVFNGNPGQSAKLNARQSVFAAKSPNLMSAKCTTPTVCVYTGLVAGTATVWQGPCWAYHEYVTVLIVLCSTIPYIVIAPQKLPY